MNENRPIYSGSSHMAHNNDDSRERWLLRHDRVNEPISEIEYSRIGEYILKLKGAIAEIPVRGEFATAIVDAIDNDLAHYKWSVTGGRSIRTSKVNTSVALSRIVLSRKLGRPLNRNEVCDFINHNSFDCRRSNLRIASLTQARQHRRKFNNNTSGYKGVYWIEQERVWKARIYVNGKQIWLGKFDNKYDAHIAYCKAAKRLHGEFACLE